MNNGSEKICAGIVTYNPQIDLLKKNIQSVSGQVDKIYIFDNGSNNIYEWAPIMDNDRIIIMKSCSNEGIAYALNSLCNIADEDGYQWILTLDQDSISPKNLVKSLSSHLGEDVAIVAPNILYKNNEHYLDKSRKGVFEEDWVITSASLTNIKVWKAIGRFDEQMFIDGVDREFCIRARLSKYKVLKCFDVQLLHELGELNCKRILGRTIYVTNHSPIRKYYMVRNSIYIDRKFHRKDSGKYIFKMCVKTLIYENQRGKKIKAIISGIMDGRKMVVKREY